ncbi:tetratricopeptide repeat protein [Treponema sp. OMZ 840]|uniref:tetratricopeptide repeat protein n=1 Tax=Treponema sp. OMZ 840 TaxID=244313 RepID=UPI003D91326F
MDTFQIILICVLGVGACFLAFFLIKSFVVPKKIESIQRLLKQGKTTAAIKTAKAIIASDSRDYKAHYYLGKAYLADNKPELALMEFKTVGQNAVFDTMNIPEKEFRKLSSELYARFNHDDEALQEYLLLTKLEPTNAENFYNAAVLFEKKNKTDQALGYYNMAIKANKRFGKAYAALGMILYRSKQYGEAKKAIDHALSLSPDMFSFYYYLGKILKDSKDYAGAVNAFEKALRDPEFRQRSLIERGSCYMAANNVEKAVDEFDRAVKTSKDEGSKETLYARYFLAGCYEMQRKIDLAIVQWKKIAEKNKNFRDVSAKLVEYKDLQDNDSMKEYLTASEQPFGELCKSVAIKGLQCSPKDVNITKYGCKIIAVDAKNENWRNVRQQLVLLVFYRESDPIEEAVLRSLVDEIKKQNYVKGIVCTSSDFTRSAISFAESRPLELVGKEKLQQLLSKADI